MEITELINRLLDSHRDVDIAEVEFRRMLDDDPDLRAVYSEWCDENGYTTRHGFADYAAEYIEMQNSVWDSLTDYDSTEL